MANWKTTNSVITTSGVNLLSKAQIGLGKIEITRVISRDTISTAEENRMYTISDIPDDSIKQTGVLIRSFTKDGVSNITARFSNEKLDEDYTYTINQIIVMARLVDDTGVITVDELPYFVLQSDGEGDVLPPKKDNPTSFDYNLSIIHTGVPNITINVLSSGFVSEEEFADYKSEVLTDIINIRVEILNNAKAEVGQLCENLKFVPWKPIYDEETRAWDREASIYSLVIGESNTERFNQYSESPEDDLLPGGFSSGSFASGHHSHAEGLNNITLSYNSHVEGAYNYIGYALDDLEKDSEKGAWNSHVEGSANTSVVGNNAHVEGSNNYNEGENSHVGGTKNINLGSTNHVDGEFNTLDNTTKACDVKGYKNKVSENTDKTLVQGSNNTVLNSHDSFIVGDSNTCDGLYQCSVSGFDNRVNTSTGTNVGGEHNTTLDVSHVSVSGSNCTVSNSVASVIHGVGLKSSNSTAQTILGQYNSEDISNKYSLIIGGGSSNTVRRNILTLDKNGNLNSSGSVTSGSADLAEYFEWSDLNKNSEDRRGLFVTLDEDKISLANYTSDYAIGCVSASPALVANDPQEWGSKYMTDVFGSVLYEEVECVIEGVTTTVKTPVLNKDYKDSEDYIPRSLRKEWSPVAIYGRVVAVDDGTCEPNGYCRPHKNGVATKSETGFRVLKRIDPNHILVWISDAVHFD